MRNNQQSVNFTGTQNCMYVGTLNDLRRFKPLQDGQVVLCSGQNYVADGQGNYYSWSSTATGTDDGITIIVSQFSGQTGRWLILNKQGNIDAVVASLNNETTNRINADNALQANITAERNRAMGAESVLNTNKVNRDGDVMYGTLNIQNNAGILLSSSYTHTSGNIEETNGIKINANSGSGTLDLSLKQNDSEYYASLEVNGKELTFGDTNGKNEIASVSDITTAVEAACSSGTLSNGNGYWTQVGSILTLSFWPGYAVGGGGTVYFPKTFSTIPCVTITAVSDFGGEYDNRNIYNVTTSSFQIATGAGAASINVMAVGLVAS